MVDPLFLCMTVIIFVLNFGEFILLQLAKPAFFFYTSCQGSNCDIVYITPINYNVLSNLGLFEREV